MCNKPTSLPAKKKKKSSLAMKKRFIGSATGSDILNKEHQGCNNNSSWQDEKSNHNVLVRNGSV